MNYYKQIAEMLGLELGQEFRLIKSDGEKVDDDLYKITEDGIVYQKEKNGFWLSEPSSTLSCLLKGSYKAVPKPWKPKEGEEYWHYSEAWKEAIPYDWEGGFNDLLLWNARNCFKTAEEARTKGKEAMERIGKEFEEA